MRITAVKLLCTLLASTLALSALAQGTAFTYQGRLDDAGHPAHGIYDLRFALYDDASAGAQQGQAVTNAAIAVSNGLFTVTLDFGNQFPGAARWLELGVTTNGGGTFTTLTPRQPLTATPYALFAAKAGTAASASSVAAANITGTLPLVQLPPSVVTNGASGVSLSGTFSGNGAGVTNVDVRTLRQSEGLVAAWGHSLYGPTTIPMGLGNVVAIAAGSLHNLALRNDGTVAAWGYNNNGQTTIPAGLGKVAAITGGAYHNLALRSNGTVVAWGNNDFGQSALPAGLGNVGAIAAGGNHSLALRSDGTVAAWGDNHFGQTTIPPDLSNVVAIAAGAFHNLALLSDGTLAAWGNNDEGQTTFPSGLSNVVAIAAGGHHSLALRSDGTVVAWGDNRHGQSTIPAGLSNVVAITAGFFHNLTLRSDGTVFAWGNNYYGTTTIPEGLSNVVAIAGGYNHSLALHQEKIPVQVALLTANNVFQGSVTAVSFSGKDAQLTNLNAAKITSGTLTVTGTFLGSPPYIKVLESRPKGMDGGANVAGTNNFRKFNLMHTDTHNLVSTDVTGDIVLPAGTYQCRISAPAYRVNRHQTRLTTHTGAVLLFGTSEYSDKALSPGVQSRSWIEGQFTLASPSALQVQHFMSVVRAPNGLGVAADALWTDGSPVEVYSVAEFWKIR